MFIITERKATPPYGFRNFIQMPKNLQMLTSFRDDGNKLKPASRARMDYLLTLHKREIKYRSDIVDNDFWQIGLHGDCEDIALWFWKTLREDNFTSRLLICRERKINGQGHCSLVSDGHVLDFNFPIPVPIEEYCREYFNPLGVSSTNLIDPWYIAQYQFPELAG